MNVYKTAYNIWILYKKYRGGGIIEKVFLLGKVFVNHVITSIETNVWFNIDDKYLTVSQLSESSLKAKI